MVIFLGTCEKTESLLRFEIGIAASLIKWGTDQGEHRIRKLENVASVLTKC